MMGKRKVVRIRLGVAMAVCLGVAACRAVLGIEDRLAPTADAATPDVAVERDTGVSGDGGLQEREGGSCGSGQAWCAGQCVDVQANPLHCGWCGHACLETCRDRACLAKVIKTLDPDIPHNLSSRGTSLQFSQQGGVGRVRRVGKNGAGFATIASDVGASVHLALAPSRIYWSAAEKGQIGYAKIPNGMPIPILTGLQDPQGLAVSSDGAWAYYLLGGSAGALYKVPADGGPETLLASALDAPKEMTLEATRVWIVTHGLTPGMVSMNVDGSDPVVEYTGDVRAYAMDATEFVVSDGAQNLLLIKNRVTGATRTLLPSAPVGLAMDGTYVYFARQNDPLVHRIARAGGTTDVVAVASDPVSEIVVEDATELYFLAGSSVCAGTR